MGAKTINTIKTAREAFQEIRRRKEELVARKEDLLPELAPYYPGSISPPGARSTSVSRTTRPGGTLGGACRAPFFSGSRPPFPRPTP